MNKAFVAATLISFTFAAPAVAQTYTAIDCPGYDYTHAFGINDFGAIVGDCELTDGTISAYVRHLGNWTIIDGPGALTTTAWDINNRGAVVGDYFGADDRFHGFLYVDGNLTTIDYPGAVHTSAQGLDDFGRIVGIFIDDTDTWRGFVFAANRFQAIEYPHAEYTTAVGISPLGIVGSTDGEGGARGYLLRNGRYSPIAYPGADVTTANRINYSAKSSEPGVPVRTQPTPTSCRGAASHPSISPVPRSPWGGTSTILASWSDRTSMKPATMDTFVSPGAKSTTASRDRRPARDIKPISSFVRTSAQGAVHVTHDC